MLKFKNSNTNRNQLMLFPLCVEDFIPQNHLARLIDKIVEDLDTFDIEKKYSVMGRKGYHPKNLLKILFYGYSRGEFSSRKLDDRCKSDVGYMYLTVMEKPNFRTISDFRKNNHKELIIYFAEIARICFELGMIKSAGIFIDGSKIRANASAKKTKDKEGFEKMLAGIREKIGVALNEAEEIDCLENELYGDSCGNEIPEELCNEKVLEERIKEAIGKLKDKGQKKINLTDEDAVYMKERNGVIRPSYNCQIAVTEEQVIVGMDVTMEPNDTNQLISMTEKVKSTVPEFNIKSLYADSGYGTYKSMRYINEKGIDGYVNIMNPELKRVKEDKIGEYRFSRYNFSYDKENDCYYCPNGQKVEYRKYRKFRGEDIKIYRCKDCDSCNDKNLCTKARFRELAVNQDEYLLIDMQEKLSTDKGKQEYGKRMYTVEPVFGNIKHNIGFRQFLLRGCKKVKGEFSLLCIVHNIKKIYKFFNSNPCKYLKFMETNVNNFEISSNLCPQAG